MATGDVPLEADYVYCESVVDIFIVERLHNRRLCVGNCSIFPWQSSNMMKASSLYRPRAYHVVISNQQQLLN